MKKLLLFILVMSSFVYSRPTKEQLDNLIRAQAEQKFISIEESVLEDLIKDQKELIELRVKYDAKKVEYDALSARYQMHQHIDKYDIRYVIGITAASTFIVSSIFYKWRR